MSFGLLSAILFFFINLKNSIKSGWSFVILLFSQFLNNYKPLQCCKWFIQCYLVTFSFFKGMKYLNYFFHKLYILGIAVFSLFCDSIKYGILYKVFIVTWSKRLVKDTIFSTGDVLQQCVLPALFIVDIWTKSKYYIYIIL